MTNCKSRNKIDCIKLLHPLVIYVPQMSCYFCTLLSFGTRYFFFSFFFLTRLLPLPASPMIPAIFSDQIESGTWHCYCKWDQRDKTWTQTRWNGWSRSWQVWICLKSDCGRRFKGECGRLMNGGFFLGRHKKNHWVIMVFPTKNMEVPQSFSFFFTCGKACFCFLP